MNKLFWNNAIKFVRAVKILLILEGKIKLCSAQSLIWADLFYKVLQESLILQSYFLGGEKSLLFILWEKILGSILLKWSFSF